MLIPLFTLLLIAPGISCVSTNPPTFLDSFLGAFRGPAGFNVTQALSAFQIPECLSNCMPHLDDLFKAASRNISQTVAMKSMCSNLQETTDCAVNAGCSEVFSKAASHIFEIMCLQNVEAFAESFECLKESASDLQPECELSCGMQKDILDKASGNRISEILETSSICNATTCLLKCYQDGLNKKCLGSSSLVEKFMAGIVRNDANGFSEGFKWMLPEICKNQGVSLPRKIGVDLPMTVGKPATRGMSRLFEHLDRALDISNDDYETDEESESNTITTSLFIDGQVRILKCSLFDWQRKPVAIPDFEKLAMIMTRQLFPIATVDPNNPIHIATENDYHEAEQRILALNEKNARSADNEVPEGTSTVDPPVLIPADSPTWRDGDDSLVIPVDSSMKPIGAVVLIWSVFIWL